MSFRSKFTKGIAKLVRSGLRLTKHNATSLPGYIAYKLDKNILNELSKNTKFIFVTGTNGKTMTTHFLVSILKERYDKVYTNESGSNMVQGIITTLLDNPSKEETIAVLEVDEANLVRIGQNIKADYVIFTNLFKDQTDRFGNIYNVFNKLIEGMETMPDAKIIANGDLPIFNYDSMKKFNIAYYGIRDYSNISSSNDKNPEPNLEGILCPNCKSDLSYKLINYSSLGDYYCPNCDFKSPDIKYSIDNVENLLANSSDFSMGDEHYNINIGGLYNVYNALAAISVAKELGLTYEEIRLALSKQKNIFGRQENIRIDNKNITINLVKNPTGLNQIIDLMLLEKDELSLICLLNDNYADGTDISWIYDSYYEKLKELDIKDVYVSGKRAKDMKKRLELAKIYDGDIKVFDYEAEVKEIIKNAKTDNIYILSTYTAMLKLRDILGL